MVFKFKVNNLKRRYKELRKIFRRCQICGEMKIITQFNKAKENKDGYINECKICRKNRYTHICEQCGNKFRNAHKTARFCTHKCEALYKKNQVTFNCDYCGKECSVEKSKYEGHNNHFCSNKCMGEWRKNQVTFNCDYCGKECSIKKSSYYGREFHFCSNECRGKWHSETFRGNNHHSWNSNKTDEERERERSYPEYRKWRESVYERDDYTCQCCGKRGNTLNAHHLNGYNSDKEHRTDELNGITLCKGCHSELHSIYGRGNNTIEQFREFLYNKYLQTKDLKYLATLEDIDIRKHIMLTNNLSLPI